MGTAGGYKVAPGVSLCCPRSVPGTHWGGGRLCHGIQSGIFHFFVILETNWDTLVNK